MSDITIMAIVFGAGAAVYLGIQLYLLFRDRKEYKGGDDGIIRGEVDSGLHHESS